MTKNYEEKILTFLTQTPEPVDVEKIRTACGIGNWNTALTHCLDLLVQEKIQGQKTSKGWIFWTHRETPLEPWQEAKGNLQDVKISEDKVTVSLIRTVRSFAIAFPKDSREAQTLIQALKDIPKGTKIALLKTDIPEKPLVIRTLTDTTVADKGSCPLPRCRKSIFAIAVKGWLRSSFRYCCSGCV